MKNELKGMLVACLVLAGIIGAVAEGFNETVKGSFSGGAGSYTNPFDKQGIKSITAWGDAQSSNVTFRVANNLTVSTNAATSPILLADDTVVDTLEYIANGDPGKALVKNGVIYFTSTTTNLLNYEIEFTQ